MSMKIRFCEKSRGKGKIVRRLEEEFPELNVKIKSCIKQCGSCRELPVAVVDKVKVTGKDGDDLYAKLVQLIQQDAAAA
jgi:uncharacterized protein YuzB (UPF0349 family)